MTLSLQSPRQVAPEPVRPPRGARCLRVMRQRFPGFGFALSASVLVLGSGCGGAGTFKVAESAASAPPAPPREAMSAQSPQGEAAPDFADSAPAPSPAVATSAPADASGPAEPAPQPGSPSAVGALAPRREMLDIEANVNLVVPKVKHALKSLHELTTRLGGVVTEERVDSSSQYGSARVTLRVPSGSTHGVFEALEKLGNVVDQNVTARDIGKEYFDANLRLSSLEATRQRYEAILQHATKVEEILRIEQELGRIRGEIEQVKGNLRWLSDRAARATLHIVLREQAPQIAYAEEPEAKFFPSVRLPALIDFGNQGAHGYAGGGFALRVNRAFSLDLDLFERSQSEQRGPDVVLASLGGEIFSDLLGGGERRYLNPYLGWRAGYGRFGTDNQAIVGATLGLELYKNGWFGVDVEARNYLAFLGDRGAHFLVTPALSARVAF
ncbi:MAG TPA: DUF4349 domain-containing protein [Polyangiaceae bacterium]|nr:DUF4349 domain-containing protein [Polyangiaceae bacterium]